MQLRPYQSGSALEVLKELSIGGNPLLKLPTGSGKTIIAAAVVDRYLEEGKRVKFLAHRIELLRQAADKVGVHPNLSIQSVQGHEYTGPVDLIVTDEAHHSLAKTYLDIYAQYPGTPIFGMTATPVRGDGKGLGFVFTKLISVANTKELTDQGYLAPFQVFIPEHTIDATSVKKVAGNYQPKSLSKVASADAYCKKAVEEYRAKAEGLRGLVFCVDRAHSRKMAAYYCAAGFRAIHLDGSTSDQNRKQAVASYGSGDIDIIVNCNLFREGLDLPDVGFVQCLVSTTSLADYWQMVGRGMRPDTGALIFLDHTDNWLRLGLPDDESITFSLDDGVIKGRTGKRRIRGADGAVEEVEGEDEEWIGNASDLIPLDYAAVFERLVRDRGETLLSPYVKSLEKVSIKCKAGHVYATPPNTYKAGCGCPQCARGNKAKAASDFVEAVWARGEKLLTPYVSAKDKVELECRNKHIYFMNPNQYKSGAGCPKCSGNCIEEAKRKFYTVAQERGDKVCGEYEKNAARVSMECRLGHSFSTTPRQYQDRLYGCPVCRKMGKGEL